MQPGPLHGGAAVPQGQSQLVSSTQGKAFISDLGQSRSIQQQQLSSTPFASSRSRFALGYGAGINNCAEEENDEGGYVCLLEPTPPPAGEGPFVDSHEQQHQQQDQLCDNEQTPTSVSATATPTAPLRLKLRRVQQQLPEISTTTTAGDGETNTGTVARRTIRLTRRPVASVAAEEQRQEEEDSTKQEASSLAAPVETTAGMQETKNDTKEELPNGVNIPQKEEGHQQQTQQQKQQQVSTTQMAAGPSSSTGDDGATMVRRLRNFTDWGEFMSATPTPQGLYSCGCSPSIRRHSKTGVPLPSGPTPVDFSSVTEYVETKYEAERKISEGTYGEVYAGRCLATGETVALKRLKVLNGLEGFPITSLREVISLRHIGNARKRAMAANNNNNNNSGSSSGGTSTTTDSLYENKEGVKDPIEEVISLRDVLLSRTHHDIYLVFSYASCSIAGLLQRRFPFTEREIAYVFRKLLLALKKLHSMGIIHRDVKADNVFMHRNAQVQLGDFGLCVFEGSGRRAMTPSLINLAYRPPEMLLGVLAYDAKVDIWSVGCFLAQMYLRTPPFFRPHRRDGARAAGHNSSSSRAETELEQLSLVTEIIGPLATAGPDAFPPSRCQRSAQLEKLRGALADGSSPWAAFSPSLGSLFQPSLLYSQFGGFAAWFSAAAEHRRHDPALLAPSRECVDVLAAIFQLDPRRRPTAAQLLEMPFFDMRRGGREGFAESEVVERHIQRELAEKLRRYHDSHIAPSTGGAK